MAKVIVDEVLRQKLHGLQEMVELYDEAGRPLGCFLPDKLYWQLQAAADQCPYTYEELERFRAEKGGRPLADIWKSLGQT
jgi:hypothetical protein